MNDLVQEFITKCATEKARIIEEACEAAIQTGECGVSVYWKITDYSFYCEAFPDIAVPYGQIHEYENQRRPE